MQVKQLLALLKDEPMSLYRPEAAMIIDLIHTHTAAYLDVNLHSGTSIMAHIDGLEDAVKMQILAYELNDGLDLKTHQRSLQKVLAEKNKVSKMIQILIVLGMCFLLTAVTLVYLKLLLDSQTIPTWEITLIMFGGPIAVIWNYQGVLNSENKDFLFAALGKTPPGTMISTIASAFRGRSRESDQQAPYYPQRQSDPSAPPPPPYG